MKIIQTIAAYSLLLISTNIFAASSFVTPTGRITAGLPVPVTINIDKSEKDFTINISIDSQTVMSIEKTGAIQVSSIGTRFQATGSRIKTIIKFNDGTNEVFENILDLVSATVISDKTETRKSEIGGSLVEFENKGTEFLERKSVGKHLLLVRNASNLKHFVNQVDLQLKNTVQTSNVKIFGSPSWFEPMIIVSGDFSDSMVMSISSK